MKNSALNHIDIPIKEILGIMKMGLVNLNTLSPGSKPIKVKEIKLLNDNIVECHFSSNYTNSMDVKMEIVPIMTFLYGFTKDTAFNSIRFQSFAVRAFDNQNEEILFAISNVNAARLASEGNSIDWLKSTFFQENTDDYRLSVAKRMIYEIENSLRILIEKTLLNKYGEDWWLTKITSKIRKGVEERYKYEFATEPTDGNLLIKYTYILNLKDIICANWLDFQQILENKADFEKQIEKFNLIRREEAHNRIVTDEHIKNLTIIYKDILGRVSAVYSDVIPEFLIENWRLKIKEIMIMENLKPLYEEGEIDNETNLIEKLLKSINVYKNTIDNLNRLIERLQSVIVPVQKANIHNELIINLQEYKDIQEKYLEETEFFRIEVVEELNKRFLNQRQKINEFIFKFLLTES